MREFYRVTATLCWGACVVLSLGAVWNVAADLSLAESQAGWALVLWVTGTMAWLGHKTYR